eukprot:Clim_evm21s207 gene=Clim_evmTU21s207
MGTAPQSTYSKPLAGAKTAGSSGNSRTVPLPKYANENEKLREENAELVSILQRRERQYEVVMRENDRLVKKLENLNRVFMATDQQEGNFKKGIDRTDQSMLLASNGASSKEKTATQQLSGTNSDESSATARSGTPVSKNKKVLAGNGALGAAQTGNKKPHQRSSTQEDTTIHELGSASGRRVPRRSKEI